jgi:histone acetyltransferase (RNA polymerase elongator complex component)
MLLIVVYTQLIMLSLQVPINVSKLKQEASKRRKLAMQPKLMDIIAAVPEEYKEKLNPYIKSKPVRTASGKASPIPRT